MEKDDLELNIIAIKAGEEEIMSFSSGQVIENARKRQNISQAELARRIGSDRSYVCRVENGQIEPKISTFNKILHALGYKIKYSIG